MVHNNRLNVFFPDNNFRNLKKKKKKKTHICLAIRSEIPVIATVEV
jgi:hypothetical protein